MEQFEMELPLSVLILMEQLESSGYEAYVVGGCVRDVLLGRKPKDWDLCTSALPEEIIACFSKLQIRKDGMEHGTIRVIYEGVGYEITTFRTDGDYLDCRHPRQVQFIRSLSEDLLRRDFTINAMAYHPIKGLIDSFGGKADLQAKYLRCVGEPLQRFSEDALRILRGLRFAACYELEIDSDTSQAIQDCVPLLKDISQDRIKEECNRLILAKGNVVAQLFRDYTSVWNVIFPEVIPMQTCTQNHPRHQYNVWEHSLHVLENAPANLQMHWAALFHDIGKPQTKTTDENGIDHFHGHGVVSTRIARKILKRLCMSKKRANPICTLILRHDTPLPTDIKQMNRLVLAFGVKGMQKVIQFHRADSAGQSPASLEADLPKLELAQQLLDQLVEERKCLHLKDLEIDGNDLIEIRFEEEPRIGEVLDMILHLVIDGKLTNQKNVLRSEAQRIFNELAPVPTPEYPADPIPDSIDSDIHDTTPETSHPSS
ncbi:MAG: HD domain-containing protein [Ruminococcus sp.]|nr:HD domain-containing protein [Ruminococcus sp.]